MVDDKVNKIEVDIKKKTYNLIGKRIGEKIEKLRKKCNIFFYWRIKSGSTAARTSIKLYIYIRWKIIVHVYKT